MSTVIWRIHDGKPGHANQTRGLVQALAEVLPVETFDLQVSSRWHRWLWWLTRRFPPGKRLPRPNLIVGAGHSTHLAVLAARRRYGGKAVVLMKPTLPPRLFDLCLVPQHDDLAEEGNIVLTHGVLNLITPSLRQDPVRGLLLIGGPSTAHGWDSGAVVEQIATIVYNQPQIVWSLTTSRRTPPDFLELLATIDLPSLTVVPHTITGPEWVPEELGRAAHVWVSEDSVSMVYEALTSGARVGLLEVPHHRAGRVLQGLQKLRELGWLIRFSDWDRHSPLPKPAIRLYEAQRCAALLCERFQLPRAA